MKQNIIKLRNMVLEFFTVGQVAGTVCFAEKDLFEQVKEAHREWQIALNNYNYCTDPDFIDYAISNIDAKEKKFVYLIKRARKEKFSLDLNLENDNYLKSLDDQ